MDPDSTRPGRPATAGTGPEAGAGFGEPRRDLESLDVPVPGSEPSGGVGETRSQGGLLGSVKQKTTSQLNAQKVRASSQLDEIAGNVRRSTERLRSQRHDVVAAALERGVDQLERFSAQLRDRDVDELLSDLERFGRRRPALFIGSSFVAGLLLARFAKASGDDSSRSDRDRPGGGRMSGSFNRPGPGDAVGRESQ